MFEEIERLSSENNRGSNNYNEFNGSKLFEINGLTNKDIGKKIKSFSKFFLIFQIVVYAITAFIMLFVALDAAEEEGFIMWLLMVLGLGVAFVFSYYGFLLVSGFGALVEDMNSLKTISARGDSKFSKKEKKNYFINIKSMLLMEIYRTR